ncbi:MAG: transketolase [Chloroflexi bacterium]|nr:transketolase [Chloroflexota bacterium]MCY3587724.1 transketolase [Chloroflexota bacterium]MCY3685194.1 transketolase [Chloroflexota bacterium]MDE2707848.1 transketolase [Chloroflexota bacterium]MXV81009.1 transketolase [Chloroflexota bacterium]
MTTTHASAVDIDVLIEVCKRIRRHIVEMTHSAQSGHPGGSLSATEIFAALYFGGVVRHDPSNPQWERRDRVILSKGHATPVVYATLAEAGYFDAELIPSFRSLGTELQGHVVRNKPAGVEMSGGALGMGLSFAVGVALGHDLDDLPEDEGQIFVVVGDGELNEGQNWEAIMSASHFGLHRITAILDRNHFQNDGPGDEIMRIDPVGDKWAAFGWGVQYVDGHDVAAVRNALLTARARNDAPQVVICETVKGRGVSFMAENPAGWHGKGPSDDQLAQALDEIEAGLT